MSELTDRMFNNYANRAKEKHLTKEEARQLVKKNERFMRAPNKNEELFEKLLRIENRLNST